MSYSVYLPIRALLLAAILGLSPLSYLLPGWPDVAYADSDDDDDDDDDNGGRRFVSDDDDDDDDGGVAPASTSTPDRAPDEIIAADLSDADLTQLIEEGFELLQQIEATPTLVRLRIPQALTLDAARVRVRALPTGSSADFNHYYRGSQGTCDGPECLALELVGYPREGICALTDVRIGMVDTGINTGHEVFSGSDLTVQRISDERLDPSRAIHGTSVAAILIGAPESRSPGLLPDATLLAVDAFYRAGADERADAFSVAAGIDWLRIRDIGVLNLSLSGSENIVLKEAIDRIVIEDVLVIAAAGNDGPRSAPAFPAAYETTVAVTAVDVRGSVYRRANQGAHIDLAAPGVDVWTAASVSGARWKTGTSFAAPFVTAAAALSRDAQPDSTAAEIREQLIGSARDLGPPGRDEVFGAGLLNMGETCGGVAKTEG
ncbi:S8 family serine peptidase [uncultured Tateyamaria sp.]|uniref:S8 family serine peptidase n=1 Tax=uncultured Tateyamaria sp. TaxID=455651 RepID=UPI002635575C|nr:S8 family serine peptidase [uncultured Tateyamaria sp.]